MPQENGKDGAEALLAKEISALQERLLLFIEGARVENSDGVVCGDGGVPFAVETTNGETVKVAGHAGDLGQDLATVAAIMAYNKVHGIEFSADTLVADVAAVYVQEHGKFQFHTSDHVDAPDKITDCGDMHGKMTDERYGVDLTQARAAIETAQKLAKADETGEIQEQTLGAREHEELGVVVVEGDSHTLVHWLREADKPGLDEGAYGMWFVIDPVRGESRRRAVLEAMDYTAEQVDEIISIKAVQDGVTNSRLAVGKHVFGVSVDDADNVEVRHIGTVQEDGSIA